MERERVIQQVVEKLATNGLLSLPPHKQKHHRKAKKEALLEGRLHSLLSHSLSESGLNYAHVLPPPIIDPAPTDPIDRPLVLARHEGPEQTIAERQVRPHSTTKRAKRVEKESRLRDNPLFEKPKLKSAARKVDKPKAAPDEQAPVDEDAAWTDLTKVPYNMDKKTWILLQQTKRILQQTTSSTNYRPGKIAPKPLWEASQRPPESGATATTTASAPTSLQEPVDACDTTVGAVPPTPEPNKSPPKGYQLAMLEPFPDTDPNTNDDKVWENELARQILSLYATSVKTKKTGGSPTKPAGPPTPRGDQTTAIEHSDVATRVCEDRRSRIRAVQDSWEPSHRLENGKVKLCLPKIPRPIWFAGTGVVLATWCALAGPEIEGHKHAPDRTYLAGEPVLCRHLLCDDLRHLEQSGAHEKYIAVVETLLMARLRTHFKTLDDIDIKLWRQLVITCNAFASRNIDAKKHAVALQLIKKTEALLDDSTLLLGPARAELVAFIADSYAHYYYSRGKAHAGLKYCSKAHGTHVKLGEWSHVAKAKLHMAALLSRLERHDAAIQALHEILQLVESAQLEDAGGASAQKLCLVAVTYNNLALEQLHVRDIDRASTASQNARRLARLCLSYSNRWLSQLEATHKAVVRAMTTVLGDDCAFDMELVMKYDIEA
ncbi:hypothetical protein SPRG_00778 [Saprolegnia parasitica CBS 223.65]|uniref:Uncharacterized protein n=1 Tax=Saprolegnia parasitica (strain CBS 223.65) TaxID=695850 RepID=A0A067D7W3_SAPPC|nr:hypothetical protein SPRG_00778 [Saprolegnia parasitica CBS 223.65]KDO34716.1 hypothetical protein SPRG_00778 [Saprolegnia parasitica CBS 223.65]|eukprot:XP_012194385.1 hypothetical protein SPRG_00778 [Saprolegnia parasitica CBS 223.65]